jgi:hypothetical protein
MNIAYVNYGRSGVNGNSPQLGPHPNVEQDASVPNWHAGSIANLIWNRTALLNYQVPTIAPSLGLMVDCAARAGIPGALLICVNASNAPQTRTIPISAYETAGQNIVRYRAQYNAIGPLSMIGPGTATDTVTLAPGEAVWYAFPAASAGFVNQPTIVPQWPSEVNGATDVVVHFGYDFYNLNAAFADVDCGSAFPCTIPADENIGTVYYRLIYRNSSGVVLATSDVATF